VVFTEGSCAAFPSLSWLPAGLASNVWRPARSFGPLVDPDLGDWQSTRDAGRRAGHAPARAAVHEDGTPRSGPHGTVLNEVALLLVPEGMQEQMGRWREGSCPLRGGQNEGGGPPTVGTGPRRSQGMAYQVGASSVAGQLLLWELCRGLHGSTAPEARPALNSSYLIV